MKKVSSVLIFLLFIVSNVLLAQVPVLDSPTDQSVTEGEFATFTTTVTSGTLPVTYQWQATFDQNALNFANIPGAIGSSYVTSPTTLSMTNSWYRCVVTNDSGTTNSDHAVLTVNPLVPPSIVTQPTDQSILIGESATFTVVASGTSPLAYQWFANSIVIPGATLTSYSTGAISDIAANGTLVYCEVTNAAGSASSNNATLTVSYDNSRITDGLQVLYNFNEGTGNTVNDVSGVGNALNLNISNLFDAKWTDNGLNINGRVSIISNGPASKIYSACTATNEVTFEAWLLPSNTTQRTWNARIMTLSDDVMNESNLKIIQQLSEYKSLLRTSTSGLNGAEFIDTAKAKVKPTHFVFTRDDAGNVVTYIDGVKSTESTVDGNFSNWNSAYKLFVGNDVETQVYWEGTYYQMAMYSKALSESEVGQNYSFGTSFDNYPLVIKNPEDLVVSSGTRATFSVLAIGTAPLSYQWRKNGSDISGATSATYTTDPLSAGDNNSEYTCYVSNGDGNTTSSGATVTVLMTGSRITNGAVAIYNFSEGSGTTITDQSGSGSPLNLNISDENDVEWSQNGLEINSEASIISSSAATKIHTECTSSNEFAIEAWIKPANTTQNGPSRVLTFSQDANARNFSLSQDGPRYEVRVRTDASDNNGKVVYTDSSTAKTELQHIVIVVSVNNVVRVYINGVEQLNKDLGENIYNWDSTYRLSIANELLDSRPWLGTVNYIAIFDRILYASEVQHNYEIGAYGVGSIQAPSSLVASEQTVGKVVLNWADNSNNEDGFKIERSILDTLHYIEVGSESSGMTLFTDSTVNEGTQYYYRTTAYNDFTNTESDYSNQLAFISNLYTPSELSSDASVLGEVSLTWADNSSSEVGYVIERGSGDPIVYTILDSIGASNYKDASVEEGILYSYRVRAFNDLIESANSNIHVIRSKASFVSKPTSLEVPLDGVRGVPVLTWIDNAFNETGYKVERKTIEVGAEFTEIVSLDADVTTYMDITVKDSTAYVYRVQAFNDDYSSEFSNEGFIQVVVDVEQVEEIPSEFSLAQNYPNPFNPSTTIKFGLPSSANVIVKLYNLLGQEMVTIADGFYSAGTYQINFDASQLTSGIYIYTISAKNGLDDHFVQSKKMILLK